LPLLFVSIYLPGKHISGLVDEIGKLRKLRTIKGVFGKMLQVSELAFQFAMMN